jgi:hypothetical protein
MKTAFTCGMLVFWIGCAPPAERQVRPGADTTAQVQSPPSGGGQPSPTVWKENMSMFGAALIDIRLIDNYRYEMTLELRTVLPSGGAESLAESGQTVVVTPEYVLGADGNISLEVERNRRLFQLRGRKPGDAVMGRLTLHADGTWHLIDTEFQ